MAHLSSQHVEDVGGRGRRISEIKDHLVYNSRTARAISSFLQGVRDPASGPNY